VKELERKIARQTASITQQRAKIGTCSKEAKSRQDVELRALQEKISLPNQ
jgi:hypothetical protein